MKSDWPYRLEVLSLIFDTQARVYAIDVCALEGFWARSFVGITYENGRWTVDLFWLRVLATGCDGPLF